MITRLLAVFLVACAALFAQSVRDCGIALGSHVRTIDVSTLSTEQVSVVKNFLATMSYEQVEAGGFIGIGKLSIGGEYSREKHNRLVSSFMSSSLSSFDYRKLRTFVPAEAFAAWSKCVDGVLGQVFRVDLRQSADPAELILEVSWRPKASLESLRIDAIECSNMTPTPYAKKLFEEGFSVEADQVKKFIVKRSDVEKNALVVVHTSYGDREAEIEAHVEPHKLVKQWMRVNEAGQPYEQSFEYQGPDCHNRPAHTQHQTERINAVGLIARIWDVDYTCVNGPAGWCYAPGDHRPKGEYGASFRLIDDGGSFTWGRSFTSHPTKIRHTAKFEVFREVCSPDCKARGEHSK